MGVVGADPGKGVRRTGDVALGEAGVNSECKTVVKISFDCSVGKKKCQIALARLPQGSLTPEEQHADGL